MKPFKQTSVSSPTYAVGGKAKGKNMAYASGGSVANEIAQGFSQGYNMGSKKSEDTAERKPSKLAIKFDDGSTIADNLRATGTKIKNSLPTLLGGAKTDE